MASAGDVNGDGYADVIVGAPDVDSSTGRAMVHLGGAEGLSATPDVVLTGPDGPFGLFGVSVAGAGDVNGDCYADVIVGAWNFPADVHLSRRSGGPRHHGRRRSLSAPDAGVVGDFGYWVAGAGDINGDGYADVLVGAGAIDNVRGRAYLYLGGPAGMAAASRRNPGRSRRRRSLRRERHRCRRHRWRRLRRRRRLRRLGGLVRGPDSSRLPGGPPASALRRRRRS